MGQTNEQLIELVKSKVGVFHDFPKEGIVFRFANDFVPEKLNRFFS